jgi:hypothetical protein
VGARILSACTGDPDAQSYELAAARTWRKNAWADVQGMALDLELVRCATLAPSSHNTQCWKFAIETKAITILPDLSRRCPAVDPDDHHLFVSLGCAAENLAQSALAHGLKAEARFDASRQAVVVALAPVPAQVSPLFCAMASRQCTRLEYDAKPLSRVELTLLERAGTSNAVRMLLLTEHAAMELVLDAVVQANTVQIADRAFVRELKSWIRFNGSQAARTGDGLFTRASGNPTIPTWLGKLAFGSLFTVKNENAKYVRQMRSSAGIAVFVGEAADKAHWVEVGRCYERFALQAAALGIRNALVNQPLEGPAVRSPFGNALGLAGLRPDLVVRFGRGPTSPRSLRRPVQAVLV